MEKVRLPSYCSIDLLEENIGESGPTIISNASINDDISVSEDSLPDLVS